LPIRPELRHFYGREWREVTRPRILARAKKRCEQCDVPNHETVTRVEGWWLEWILAFGAEPVCRWRDETGGIYDDPDAPPRLKARAVRIVLAVAHLNHVPGDDREKNLEALCQWCHLNYDKLHHRATREARKDAARPLLQKECLSGAR
jgi:hypothetical protein